MEYLIPLKDYAELYMVREDSVRWKCNRGSFITARKISSIWFIDKREPPVDWKKNDVQQCVNVLIALGYIVEKRKNKFYLVFEDSWHEVPSKMKILKKILEGGVKA